MKLWHTWRCFLLLAATLSGSLRLAAQSVTIASAANVWPIYIDNGASPTIAIASQHFASDIELLTRAKPTITNQISAKNGGVIIAGLNTDHLITQLAQQGKLRTTTATQHWEGFSIQLVNNPLPGVDKALVICGNNPRGVAYGLFHLSALWGISPWHWWADVPVAVKPSLQLPDNFFAEDFPRVQYRGIFINDEAPALSGWTKEKFGGFNSKFYRRVFELMLRLKANYIWPAMWGNAFYADDSTNIKAATDYGIVIGTSHHEPLMRAHDEWRRFGKGPWNYEQNENTLQQFWTAGMQRATNEKIVTVGMRGDGDEPMTDKTATALLERIVADQRKIIATVTGKPANETPQLWALYKEVQDYYDKGMQVPEDITLLLCDDNWGNIRRLPAPQSPARKGGYGIYYHFDYVGGPRNYKWINTNQISRVWEQMHMAWQHGVNKIWIVNVGDIKPMEFPISFFLDYAWNPDAIGPNDLQSYTAAWCTQQFGSNYASDIAEIITTYTQFAAQCKPELLDADTYSFNYDEWPRMVAAWNELLEKTEQLYNKIPPSFQDAFFQLVLHPVKASANLYNMYYHVARNRQAAAKGWIIANTYAEQAKACYIQDSLITMAYHTLQNGKWNHMMAQTHIGYTNWQQPEKQKIPLLQFVSADTALPMPAVAATPTPKKANVPETVHGIAWYEEGDKGVSIIASQYSTVVNSNTHQWTVLPNHGRTGSGITILPTTAPPQVVTKNAAHLIYDCYTYSSGQVSISTYCSPSLNFLNTREGLQYAMAIDDEEPQIISINSGVEVNYTSVWNKWVANNIIITNSKHNILSAGKHQVKIWAITPGVVLQKIVLDFGSVKPSYLGPPATIYHNK